MGIRAKLAILYIAAALAITVLEIRLQPVLSAGPITVIVLSWIVAIYLGWGGARQKK